MKDMEQYNNLGSLSELVTSQPLKTMVTQLLVSMSIFSLVFSWSSLRLTSPLMYYEKLYYFSCNSSQLLSIAMNKNCIFLICNGILVFLAKTSAIVRSPSSYDLSDMLQKKIGDDLQIETESEPVLEKHIMFEENGNSTKQEEEEEEDDDDDDDDDDEDEEEAMKLNEEAEEFKCSNETAKEEERDKKEEEEGEIKLNEAAEEFKRSNERAKEEERGEEEIKLDVAAEEFKCSNERAEEVPISIAESDEEGGLISDHHYEDVENDQSGPKNCWLFDDGGGGGEDDEQVFAEEEDEGNEMEKLSIEELNQKCEDFIRRMKEEFRISETRQQLLMVN